MAKKEQDFVKEITPKSEDYSQWYLDVILKTKMVDYSTVKGCMVIRPYGYALWENMQKELDRRFKETGHENAYFPLFIPESLLKKEMEHVEGFAPEVAWVTHGGYEELQERLCVRPTSETIICSMYSDWIQTYRDLPVLTNQWCNVVRWEKSTRPFLRTTEFLWQEGHTAHRNEEDAEEETLKMLNVYADFAENVLAIPVIKGQKTEKERFAGALRTYSIEALMSDGKALQAGTSHNLGEHFAKVFDIQYLDSDNELKYVWQTSWGVSTRMIGAVIMVHGDDRGLKMPPKVAPTQIVVVPIPAKDPELVNSKVDALYNSLKTKFRIKVDDRDGYRPGWKFNEWEMKGVPVRLEIGPKDIEKGQVVAARRDTGEKIFIPEEKLEETLYQLLEDIQKNMYEQAKQFLADNTYVAHNYDELKEIVEEKRGMAKAMVCGDEACEIKVKEETGATIRNIPFEQEDLGEVCAVCGKPKKHMVIFAKSY
jgi:prolyl-tRNA synthetase